MTCCLSTFSVSSGFAKRWGNVGCDRAPFETDWWHLWSWREKSAQMGSQKGRLKPQPSAPRRALCKPCSLPILQAQSSVLDPLLLGDWHLQSAQAKSRVCHMSPSLKHHLILQHAPDVTSCHFRETPHGHMQTVDTSQMVLYFFLCISDGGDVGQGAGQISDGDGHSAGDSDNGKCRVLIHYFNECTWTWSLMRNGTRM